MTYSNAARTRLTRLAGTWPTGLGAGILLLLLPFDLVYAGSGVQSTLPRTA